MKQVPGISRVSIKKSKHVVFVINNPDVFRAPGSDTVVIFGEAKVEDAGAQLAQLGLERLGMGAGAGAGAGPASAGGADAVVGGATVVEEEDADGAGAAAADEGGEPVDEAGVEAKDVDLVMTQASVSRAKAVAALKASGGDIVAAIMELTM
jgi:nascent polypeptide-associated complex subunit alpha